MESAESNREDESREEPHPMSPSVQEGGSNLLHENGGPFLAATLAPGSTDSSMSPSPGKLYHILVKLGKIGDRESEEHLGFNSSFLENPYLSSERLRTEEIMTIEFVAVLSKKSIFSEKSSTVCVAFYKKPGQYQKFAVMRKRGEVITGCARIPISDLQKGPIFYKYAILKNALSADRESRIWDLEHVYGMDSKNTESQLHRVLSIPKEEIKADGRCHTSFKSETQMKYDQ
ncbi:hypothetical protein Q9233_012119 [Columba guinea]|nr:hypothetical protein Q9233_012119 [Columba guinea]